MALVLTQGEPAGVGFEIAAKAWAALRQFSSTPFFLLGDAEAFSGRTIAAGLQTPVIIIDHPRQADAVFAQALPILHRALPQPSTPGQLNVKNSPQVIKLVEEAVELCLVHSVRGMVTNPIHKDALYSAGFNHQGHTDFLAALARAKGHEAQDVMMLVGGGLRAVPVTVHIPLLDVPPALTTDLIVAQGLETAKGLERHFGIIKPRLAVTGLNPHAGENGAMGREEIDVIIPAVERLRAHGIDVFGPISADTAFHDEMRQTYDAILCMYHDQALIPVKTLDFHGGVNVTLGLPFVRTSPDHGTALGIAGTGKANATSLIAALKLAAAMTSAP